MSNPSRRACTRLKPTRPLRSGGQGLRQSLATAQAVIDRGKADLERMKSEFDRAGEAASGKAGGAAGVEQKKSAYDAQVASMRESGTRLAQSRRSGSSPPRSWLLPKSASLKMRGPDARQRHAEQVRRLRAAGRHRHQPAGAGGRDRGPRRAELLRQPYYDHRRYVGDHGRGEGGRERYGECARWASRSR